jgi:hypothetical protein
MDGASAHMGLALVEYKDYRWQWLCMQQRVD